MAFRVTYPTTGTTFDSHYLAGGGTLREVALEHPMAHVELIEGTRVEVRP